MIVVVIVAVAIVSSFLTAHQHIEGHSVPQCQVAIAVCSSCSTAVYSMQCECIINYILVKARHVIYSFWVVIFWFLQRSLTHSSTAWLQSSSAEAFPRRPQCMGWRLRQCWQTVGWARLSASSWVCIYAFDIVAASQLRWISVILVW